MEHGGSLKPCCYLFIYLSIYLFAYLFIYLLVCLLVYFMSFAHHSLSPSNRYEVDFVKPWIGFELLKEISANLLVPTETSQEGVH